MGSFKRSIKSLEHGQYIISGSFAPAGTGAVTSVRGQGFTVARSGVGTFTITLADRYNELIAAQGTVQLSSAADMAVQFGDYTAASKTLVLRTQAAATETDIAADANNRVFFTLVLRKSTAN